MAYSSLSSEVYVAIGLSFVWAAVSISALFRGDAQLFQGAGFFAAIFGVWFAAQVGAKHSETTLDLNKLEILHEIDGAQVRTLALLVDDLSAFELQIATDRLLLKMMEQTNSSTTEENGKVLTQSREQLADLLNQAEQIAVDTKSAAKQSFVKIKDRHDQLDSSLEELAASISETDVLMRRFEAYLALVGALQGSFGYLLFGQKKSRKVS